MRRIIDSDILTFLVRLVVGGVFIYASLYKIIDPGSFARSIWYYHMVPGDLINLIAIILPWIELLAGLGIIFGVLYRGSVVWVNLLTILFLIMLGTAIMRGLSIDCGCFKAGAKATEAAWDSFYFDLGLLIFTLQLWCSRSIRWRLSPAKK